MRVDFYQLGPGADSDGVISAIGRKLLDEDRRLIIVSKDEAQISRLDRVLWDQGSTSFIPHGRSGAGDEPRQPILLSSASDAPNGARNMLIADGEWREAALHFERAFYLFDDATIDGARSAWKDLGDKADVERHYWANEEGRWVEKA